MSTRAITQNLLTRIATPVELNGSIAEIAGRRAALYFPYPTWATLAKTAWSVVSEGCPAVTVPS